MAILVVLLVDNTHPDPGLNRLRCQKGDVVDIVEDGHVFSDGEMNCGRYRFLRVPGVAGDALAAQMAEVVEALERLRAMASSQMAMMTAPRVILRDENGLAAGVRVEGMADRLVARDGAGNIQGLN